MGNCFKASSHDDISLLQDSDVPENNGEYPAPNVPPPPPYQVSTVNCVKFYSTVTNRLICNNYGNNYQWLNRDSKWKTKTKTATVTLKTKISGTESQQVPRPRQLDMRNGVKEDMISFDLSLATQRLCKFRTSGGIKWRWKLVSPGSPENDLKWWHMLKYCDAI